MEMFSSTKSNKPAKLVTEGTIAGTRDVKLHHIKTAKTKIAAVKTSANQKMESHELKNDTLKCKNYRDKDEFPAPGSTPEANIPPKSNNGDVQPPPPVRDSRAQKPPAGEKAKSWQILRKMKTRKQPPNHTLKFFCSETPNNIPAFNRTNYEVAISVYLLSYKVRPVQSIFDTGVVPIW